MKNSHKYIYIYMNMYAYFCSLLFVAYSWPPLGRAGSCWLLRRGSTAAAIVNSWRDCG